MVRPLRRRRKLHIHMMNTSQYMRRCAPHVCSHLRLLVCLPGLVLT
jgi:hypothetical protein